jgi:hypothetical protein
MLSPKTLKQIKVALIDKSLSVQRAAAVVHNLTQTPTSNTPKNDTPMPEGGSSASLPPQMAKAGDNGVWTF